MERLGKYRVIAKIGEGGMARVMLVMSDDVPGFHKLMVVKELKEELAHDDEFLTMFLDEAKLVARLNHPNIVQSYEVGEFDGRHFITMEYLEGQPLNAFLRRIGRARVPLPVHVRVLVDVLSGLEYAHGLTDFDGTPLRVVHRDVTPHNVFLTYDGQVKLVDFGIAKMEGADSVTRQGVIKGKLSYISPEQVVGDEIDDRADIFAVGVMLWEALAKQRISGQRDEASVIARRVQGLDPSLRDLELGPDTDPDFDPCLIEVCERAMATSRDERYANAGEFRAALEAYLEGGHHRVSARDLGQLVSDAFATEREKIRGIIKSCAESEVVDAPISLDLHPERLRATSMSLPAVSMPPGSGDGFGRSYESTTDGPPSETPSERATRLTNTLSQPPRRALRERNPSRNWRLAAALGVALIVAAGLILTRPASKPANPTVAAPSALASASTVRIRIEYPPRAVLTLDGGRVSDNPFVTDVQKDGTIHQVEVRQAGFEPQRHTLTFGRDQTLQIRLRRSPAVPTGPAPSSTADDIAPPGSKAPVRRPLGEGGA
ncbi:MAG: serine/threonine-protein kinase [Myxococcota bacterium]